MNTMFQNNQNSNLLQQISNFADNLKKRGQNPQVLLDQLVKSGKVSQEQLNRATMMAKMFQGKI